MPVTLEEARMIEKAREATSQSVPEGIPKESHIEDEELTMRFWENIVTKDLCRALHCPNPNSGDTPPATKA